MKQLSNIILILLILSGCATVQQEYYYKSNNNQTDWSHEFFVGEGGGKRVQSPAREVLTYSYEKLKISFYISYLDITAIGPVIIPIIPTPWDSDRELRIFVDVNTGSKDVQFDMTKWKVKVISTREHYPPLKAETTPYIYEPTSVTQGLDSNYSKRDTHLSYGLHFPVKLSEIDEMEINIGSFTYGEKVLTPSIVKLKKIKGDWYFNGFTV